MKYIFLLITMLLLTNCTYAEQITKQRIEPTEQTDELTKQIIEATKQLENTTDYKSYLVYKDAYEKLQRQYQDQIDTVRALPEFKALRKLELQRQLKELETRKAKLKEQLKNGK